MEIRNKVENSYQYAQTNSHWEVNDGESYAEENAHAE